MSIQLELDADATRHSVVFMCLGADIELVITEQDEMPPHRGIPIRKTSLFQFGSEYSTAVCVDGGARMKSDADDLKIKLTHGDLLMLSGGGVKVCRRSVVWYWLYVTHPVYLCI